MEEKETKKVIGLMSGTSCDSIDAGLCEVNPDLSVKLVHGINYSYPEHIRANFLLRLEVKLQLKNFVSLILLSENVLLMQQMYLFQSLENLI